MTRANANPWFTDAGASNSIMPIVRFVTPTVFASKTRGYGLLFEVDGADEEGLTDPEITSKMRGVEGGVRGLTEDFSLYQYMRVTSGFEIPRQKKYADPITQSFVDHRLDFLAKTANFRRIDLHWCLTLEPKLSAPFAAKPKEQADENDRLISQLQKAATILETHLSSVIGLKVVGKEKAFKFFAELFNLEAWAGHIPLVSDQGIDQQIATSAVSWHNDHLRVGKRHVQMFSASSTPAASQPCLYNSITNLTCDSVLCTTWRPQSSSTVRKEISAQEKWIDFFKVGIFQRVMAGKNFAQLDQGAGAKAASEGVDDLGLVVKELGKKAQGKYTVTLLLSAQSAEELRENTPLVHRTFVDAQATVIEETIGNLSAFYAMFPFNQRYNVFSLWLGEDHHARLSPVFAPNIGHQKSEDLESEYLNVFETRQGTPFFHDAYVSGVRVQLTIGPPGTGKTTLMKAILDHVPVTDRLIVIEQVAELRVLQPNALRWEAVDAIPGQVAILPSALLAAALRHRPDRIIFGEIRDECANDLLQAMNTGHGGTLTTLHAKSAWDALSRLSNLALSARPNINHSFIRSETADAIDFVLYCERLPSGRRRVRELIAVTGYDFATQSFETDDLYRADDHADEPVIPTHAA